MRSLGACSACGRRLPSDAAFCSGCGAAVAVFEPSPRPHAPPPTPGPGNDRKLWITALTGVVGIVVGAAVKFCEEGERRARQQEIFESLALHERERARTEPQPVAATPKVAWRTSVDRLRIVEQGLMPRLRRRFPDARSVAVAERSWPSADAARVDLEATSPDPLRGHVTLLFSDTGVTLCLGLADPASWADPASPFSTAESAVFQMALEHPGRLAREGLDLPGWERLGDDELIFPPAAGTGVVRRTGGELAIIMVAPLSRPLVAEMFPGLRLGLW